MPIELDGQLKGDIAHGHRINFCEHCDGLFCEHCSDADESGLYCSNKCEKADK